ncbi:alanine racemase [Kineothrix sp. MB12-C1]|uniref:alanine racemase n=1 Tax=Kineothrix sp. MB12-C1 TaxID=3070215 RepID=UPI0027D241CE|nr:alanine racemase [Kineothrix sp. MB12-C1]WMC91341.1 alanine racemase [Kineothrix sp. MB12-C1]
MIDKNENLIKAAFALHQDGRVLPDSYLIDVDMFLKNAEKILHKAKEYKIKLYFMLKQLGRNPYLAKELVRLGYEGAVVVDFKEAQLMMQHQIPIGNVGHLVQIPETMIPKTIAYRPEVITVYSYNKVKSIDKAAGDAGITQGILLRVYGDKDAIYSGQTAGISLNEVKDFALRVKAECKNIQIKGVTSFPCFLYDDEKRDIVPTNNLDTVKEAVEMLKELGITPDIINTPSATCVYTLDKIAAYGGNCGEPGHGLTGTTPLHAARDMEEIPSVVYVSEISHNFKGEAYCYGGGHYRRSHASNTLVGKNMESAERLSVIVPNEDSIDYHFAISKECTIGDTVLMAFRFQIFVTRSDVVLVKGISTGKPEVVGIYDSLGNKKE